MKAYDYESGDIYEYNEYIGNWDRGNVYPDDVLLFVNGQTRDFWISSRRNSGGVPVDEYNGLIKTFSLPGHIYSLGEVESILNDVKEVVNNLLESYEESYRNGNLCGYWGEDEVFSIYKYFEQSVTGSTLCFDSDGELEEEEEEEEEE